MTVDKHYSTVKQMECHMSNLPQPSRLVDSVIQQINEHTVCLSVRTSVCLSVCLFAALLSLSSDDCYVYLCCYQ